MTPPRISVLIPTYNRAAYLEKALESVRQQDYANVEIVVSDNASTDSTPSLKDNYKNDARIRWYRNEQNVGLAGNWRKLVYDLAQGDYAKILADDDFLAHPKHLSDAASLIQKHGVDVVFAGAGSYEGETDTMVSRSWDLPEQLTPDWWMRNIGAREKGKTLFPNLTTSGLFRLEKAKALQAFIDPVFGMDYQLGFELMLSGPSGYLRGIHGAERKHRENDGANASLEVVLSCLQLYDRILSYGLKQGLPETEVRRFCRRFMTVMVKGFVLYTWSRDKGASPGSARALHRTLVNVDPVLARSIFTSPECLGRFFLGGNPKRQETLRRVYYQFCLKREAIRERFHKFL